MADITLIRGVISITIGRAKHLGHENTVLSKVSNFFTCSTHAPVDAGGTYVKAKIGDSKIGETKHIEQNHALKWAETFRADLAHEAKYLSLEVHCDEIGGDKIIGKVLVSVEDMVNTPDTPNDWRIFASNSAEEPLERDGKYLPLSNNQGEPTSASLGVIMKYTPVLQLKSQKSVDGSYFTLHSNCKMTLYQDSVTPYNPLHENIKLADDSTYEPRSAWKDMYEAICQAKHFIYITGWSIWTDIKMVRENEETETLGELLVRKAEEGVTVLGLVWDEKSSNCIIPGLMGTDDEETQKYFQGKNMDIELVYRKKEGRNLNMKGQLYEWVYSHHQKCLMVDAPAADDSSKSRIVSFLGGLDFARGRYDTPNHSLFSTLKSDHQGDFYQKCVSVGDEVGPRQPWHDIHCKVEGPAAVDVLVNFEERWKKQVPLKSGKLIDIYSKQFDLTSAVLEKDPELWDCQISRSITGDSVKFENTIRENQLVRKAGALCDDSIHRVYVHHIRRAEKFIYIENQYFLGSAYAWDNDNKPKADHVIPFELTNRIIEKIKMSERFCVYIVLPMYPEGNPADKVVQEILHWQKNTIEMMYKRIKSAISEQGLLTTPTDYLNIYCLGKREALSPPDDLSDPNPEKPVEMTLRETRRFMIYVHSKMMIIDDEYIIVGSANINQRSMAGTRDTEIAVGALQPNHTYDGETLPKGQVHAFRLALWAEHTAAVEDCFMDPTSEECIKRINEIAQRNWEIYTADETEDTQGYLMTYPYVIEEDGSIKAIEGIEHFPDFETKAKILGSNSFLPNKLTT